MSIERLVRFGILGTGRIVNKYAEVFRAARGVELVAIASRELARAQETATRLGIPRAQGSYEALLADAGVDAIINVLHNGLHCAWTCRALAAGKHVLCEKPLACSYTEAEQMFAAAHRSRRWLAEGFMYRFHPQMIAAQRLVADGAIGRIAYIHSARTAYGRERDNPRHRKDAGGGALLDVGCYCVNISRLFAGTEPVRVLARADWDRETGVDLTTTGVLEFPDGVTAQFVSSMVLEPTYAVEVIGDKGRLAIPHPWGPPAWPAELYLTRESKTETIRIEPHGRPAHALMQFILEVEQFADCIRQNRAPTFPLDRDGERDALGNARVLDGLFESARKGNPVELVNCS